MGLKSYKQSKEEQDALATTPNAISVMRGVGGIALGAMLAANSIEPNVAFIASTGLAISDMEGSLIEATSRWPRLQKNLRVIPSVIGRKLDPVMDKVFGVSVFTGAAIGGQLPLEQAVPLLAAEALTAGATMYVVGRGGDPEVSKAGTWGMVARIGAISLNLGASAATELSGVHDSLRAGGAISTGAALTLGAFSVYDILRQRPIRQSKEDGLKG